MHIDLNFQDGQTLLFNKPKHWTSFDVVKKVRRIVKVKKVGHAGTLDPLATGLLILCTGKHTKQITAIQELDKEYELVFKLGATTPSYDAEFPEENIKDASHISPTDIEEALEGFRGGIVQMPPIFSAVKIDGKRAYKSARKGKEVQLRPRWVTVHQFDLLNTDSLDAVQAKVRCSKGTYIRSLVHDLGQVLGVGGYIRELSRTRIGTHRLQDAWEIADFEREVKAKRGG